MSAPITITEVSFGLTVNLGNYESARIDMSAKVNTGQDYQSVLEELRALVGAEISMEKDVQKRRSQSASPPFEDVAMVANDAPSPMPIQSSQPRTRRR